MRVLFFSNWFPPVISGSSFYTSSLAQALVERGHEVEVVTVDWGPEYAPAAPFPVHRLPCLRLPRTALFYNARLMGFTFTPANRKRLLQIIARFRPHVLHHVNHIFDSVLLTASAARAARVPLVGSLTTPVQHEKPLRNLVMALGDRVALGWGGVRRWDGIVSLDQMVHYYVGVRFGRRAQQRSEIILFGVRREALAEYQNRTVPRAAEPLILFVGQIHPFRNPVQIIRAMPLVLQAVPQARLVLAGRVDLKEPPQVAQTLGLGQHVQFLGETAHDQVVRLMQQAHVFVSYATGPFPGLGTAPMEAMLCETPVVNDLPENLFGEGRLRNGENIILVNQHDPHSIAGALVKLLRDAELRQRIGAAGRRFVLEHLSWESIAAQMEAFYERVQARYKGTARVGGLPQTS